MRSKSEFGKVYRLIHQAILERLQDDELPFYSWRIWYVPEIRATCLQIKRHFSPGRLKKFERHISDDFLQVSHFWAPYLDGGLFELRQAEEGPATVEASK